MWPFDRSSRTEVLRICRDAVEHWAHAPAGLVLKRREVLSTPRDVTALEDAIARIFSDVTPSTKWPARVDAVIESAWLPVMLLAPGPEHRNVAGIEALLRERLSALYDSYDDPVARWQLQIDGLPGEARVPGYGLPARVREIVSRALGTAGVRVASMQPAWAWARTHDSQRSARRHTGWWFWQESDRTIVARLASGGVVSLHPGHPPLHERFDPSSIAASEAERIGVNADAALLVGGWQRPTAPARDVRWLSVAAPDAAVARASTPPVPVKHAQERP